MEDCTPNVKKFFSELQQDPDIMNIERQPPNVTNAQIHESAGVTGTNTRMKAGAGTAPQPGTSKGKKPTYTKPRSYTPAAHAFGRSTKKSYAPPPAPKPTTSSTSDVAVPTAEEIKLLSDKVAKATTHKPTDVPVIEVIPTEPTVASAINVDTSLPQEIVEVTSDEEDENVEPDVLEGIKPDIQEHIQEQDIEEAIQAQEKSDSELLYEDLLRNPFSTESDKIDQSLDRLQAMAESMDYDGMPAITREDYAALLGWLSPAISMLPAKWQFLTQFCQDNGTLSLQYLVQLAGFAHHYGWLDILNDDVKYLVGTFLHVHYADIMAYMDARGLERYEEFYDSLIYAGDESTLRIHPYLNLKRKYQEEDILRIQEMESSQDPKILHHVQFCHTIMKMAPSLHIYLKPRHGASQPTSPRPTDPTPPTTPQPSPSQKPSSSRATSPAPSTTAKNLKVPGIQKLIAKAPPDTQLTEITDAVSHRRTRTEFNRRVQRVTAHGAAPQPIDVLYEASTRMKAIEIIDEDEFIAKYGTDCVTTVGAVDTSLHSASDSQPSTILGVLSGIINAAYNAYSVINTDQLQARNIGTLISLPDIEFAYKQLFANDSFPMTILKKLNPQNFNIQATGAHPLPTTIQAPDYLISQTGIVDTKAMVNALQSMVSGFSRQMAEGVVNQALPSVSRHSMLSLFTKMWTIHLTLVTCEELGVIPEFHDLVPDDIQNIDISISNVGLQPAITQLTNAINEGRPIFDVPEINLNSLECMRLVSAGTQAIRFPAANTHELIGRQIIWEEKIKWAIIGRTGTLPVIPQNIFVHSSMMLDFIYLMQRIYHRNDDMVNGFIRASLLMTIQVASIKTAKGVSSRLINSMLEMYSTVMPISRADNIIWRLLKATKPDTSCPSADDEVKYLTMQKASYFGQLSTCVATLISLGYSHVFHTLNLDGNTLTAVACNNQRAIATDLIRGLTTTSMNETVPRLSRLAAGYLPQISAMSVSPLALLSANWSGYGITAASATPQHSWRRKFPRSIPYIVQPTTLLRFGLLLDSNWGYTQPGVKGDFKKEVCQYGPDHLRVWAACSGDPAYAAQAKDTMSYFYIPYGLLAINTIMQQTRAVIAKELRFIEIRRVDSQSGIPFAQMPVPWEDFEFSLIPELYCLRVGTLLTYDWVNGSVRSPALVLEEQLARIAALIEVEAVTDFRRAGLRYAEVRTHTQLNTNIDDVLSYRSSKNKAPKESVPKVDPPKDKVELEISKAVDSVPATPKVDEDK